MYAMAASIAVILFTIGIYFAGLRNSALNYLSYIFYIGILVFGIINWRKTARNGYLTYGQAMGYSTYVALYYSIVMAVWTYIFMAYIMDPAIMDAEFAKSAAKMQAQGMSQDQIDMGMKWARKFASPPVVAVLALFGGMFFLTIINLIVAAVMKKDPPQEGFQQPDQFQNPQSPFPPAN